MTRSLFVPSLAHNGATAECRRTGRSEAEDGERMETFMRQARVISFAAADHGSYALFERLKSMYQAQFPEHDSRQYEATTLKLARMAGV
jgi:hypothetical protein